MAAFQATVSGSRNCFSIPQSRQTATFKGSEERTACRNLPPQHCWSHLPVLCCTAGADRGTCHFQVIASFSFCRHTGGSQQYSIAGQHNRVSGIVQQPLTRVAFHGVHQRQHSLPLGASAAGSCCGPIRRLHPATGAARAGWQHYRGPDATRQLPEKPHAAFLSSKAQGLRLHLQRAAERNRKAHGTA